MATKIEAPTPARVRFTTKPTFSLPPQQPLPPNAYFRSPFAPSRHLIQAPIPKRFTMTDLGLGEQKCVSEIGVSEPFPLFTPEAVMQMRNEVLSDEVWENCRFASSIAACQLRGMSPKYAKFVYDAWTHPETLRTISAIAGIDLVPVMDYEIGHINISVGNTDDAPPVVNWHCDSYPFVCVLMLSDASSMLGGETAIKTGSGEIMKVRGPQMGSAVVLQGRYITHMALPATNTRERITMVTSFRPRDPLIPDDSQLLTVRCCSDLEEMYVQWTEYRMEILEERAKKMLKKVQERKRVGRGFDVDGVKKQMEELEAFLRKTREEIVDMEVYKIKEDKEEEEAEETRSPKRKRED